MKPEELLAIMGYLRDRVDLLPQEAGDPITIHFEVPVEKEMIAAGLNSEGVRRIIRVPWWEEMVADIVETPEMCDSDDSAEDVLEYARDVVSEYIRKRFPLNAE